jgi:hypothetical protein
MLSETQIKAALAKGETVFMGGDILLSSRIKRSKQPTSKPFPKPLYLHNQ